MESVELSYVHPTLHNSSIHSIDSNHDVIAIHEEFPGVITCHVSVKGFTDQEPEVVIKLDDIDVTSEFIKMAPSIVEDSSARKPLKRLHYSIGYKLKLLNATQNGSAAHGLQTGSGSGQSSNLKSWHQRQLRCQATMSQYTTLPTVSSTATVLILSKYIISLVHSGVCTRTHTRAHACTL